MKMMKNLDNIIDKIEKNISEKDKVREQALKYSRDIIIGCRKSMQYIHQRAMSKAKRHIEESYNLLKQLQDVTRDYRELYHAGFVENASQEFVEALCLYNIMNGKDLPDPDDINTTYSSYLLGLCDVVGELRRCSLDLLRNGNAKKVNQYLDLMEKIYDSIMRFDYPSAVVPIKKKQDMVRSMIERTRGELAIASCERRIEYHTDEFRGLLDKLNGEKRKDKSIKKKDNELDIDKVW